jgi:superfamily II RNA helicase
MSGRAGRRGLDVLGHVVFFDVPRHKLHRLIVAPVPRLRGHFALSSSLLLRLLAFQHQLPEVKGAKKEVLYAFHELALAVRSHELALMLLVCEAWSVC